MKPSAVILAACAALSFTTFSSHSAAAGSMADAASTSTPASLTAHAPAAPSSAALNITPYFPVDCRYDYPYVNRLGMVDKIAETPTSVTFSFLVEVGFCANGQFNPYAMPENPYVAPMSEKILLFQRERVTGSTKRVDETQALITLKFDKSRIFKKTPQAKFSMAFYPAGVQYPVYGTNVYGQRVWATQSPNLQFWWHLVLTDMNGLSQLQVRVVPK